MPTFRKYHGLGNDFILIDHRHSDQLLLSPAQAVAWCSRNFGIGADGVIFLLPGDPTSDFTMRIINSDGSEPEMCGNGIRCLAQFIRDLGIEAESYTIQTLAGLMIPHFAADGLITVDMGSPRLLAHEIPTTLTDPDEKVLNVPLEVAGQTWPITCVSMGNPHAVMFVEDVTQIQLSQLGPQFEHHPVFPQRINTEFVQVMDPTHLKMIVWERGAGATWACGTGACAVLVGAVLTGRAQPSAQVQLPGGSLHITWDQVDNRVFMTGPAQFVFQGEMA